MAEEYKKLQ